MEKKLIYINIEIGGLQEYQAVKTDGISVSLTAAMGMGGGQIPLIVCKLTE